VTTGRDREDVLEQWLKQSGGARSTPTPECLDAETAGAWAEGRLGGPALAEAQLHVADCARCQALMATLLRTTPEHVAAALTSTRRWLAWTMPLAAAAVLLLGAYVWTNNANAPGAALDQVAAGPTEPAAKGTQPPRANGSGPAARGRNTGAAKSLADSTTRDKNGGPARDGAASASQKPRASGAQAAGSGMPKELSGVSSDRKDSPQVAASREFRVPPPPAAAPPVAAEPQSAGAAASARDATAAQADARRETSPPADRLQTRPAAPAGSPIQVASPNRAVQWRVTADVVERTTDGGYTWSTAGALGSITSGSAPSAEVCWLAGRGGLIVRTVDGINWSRIPFPETVDLVAVGAVSAQTATVTAADGRVFVTANGGQSWVADR